LSNNILHMVALTADEELRQIVEALDGVDHWRVELVDEPTDLFSRVSHQTHIVLIDEAVTGIGYLSYVKKVRRASPAVDVVVVGGPKSEEVLSSDQKDGIDKYYARPIDAVLFDATIRHRLQYVRLKTESGLIGRSPALEEVVEAILQVAPTEVPILIEGESGTGKDVVARAVHVASRRHDQPFEAINCGAVAEGVLESELFGHEKGSFTGATSRRAGMFERAHRGTIFLDEVGETSASMQVKLLRVLESGIFLRVGGVERIHVNIRVIAATNKKLAEAVRNGEFRQDLYYRLKGINLHLPSLRSRKEDIPILSQHFIALSNKRHHKSVRGIETAAQRRFLEYPWPGNIRELKNTVDTLVVLSTTSRIPESLVSTQLVDAPHGDKAKEGQTLLPVALHRTKEEAEREMIYASILALHRDVREIISMLREGHQPSPWEGLKKVHTEPRVDLEETGSLAQMERLAIRESLNRFAGNRRKAAEALGISERTLYRKIREYGLV
jgi:DNA-binding NtrC family response regulator